MNTEAKVAHVLPPVEHAEIMTLEPEISTRASPLDRLALLLDVATGEILKIEAMDSSGQRGELSQNERLEPTKVSRGEAVEKLIGRSFEAGPRLGPKWQNPSLISLAS